MLPCIQKGIKRSFESSRKLRNHAFWLEHDVLIQLLINFGIFFHGCHYAISRALCSWVTIFGLVLDDSDLAVDVCALFSGVGITRNAPLIILFIQGIFIQLVDQLAWVLLGRFWSFRAKILLFLAVLFYIYFGNLILRCTLTLTQLFGHIRIVPRRSRPCLRNWPGAPGRHFPTHGAHQWILLVVVIPRQLRILVDALLVAWRTMRYVGGLGHGEITAILNLPKILVQTMLTNIQLKALLHHSPRLQYFWVILPDDLYWLITHNFVENRLIITLIIQWKVIVTLTGYVVAVVGVVVLCEARWVHAVLAWLRNRIRFSAELSLLA